MSEISTSGLHRIAFFSAVLSTLSWFAYIWAFSQLPQLPPLDEPHGRLRTLLAGRAQYLTYGWTGTFGALLTVPYLLAIITAIPERRLEIWLAFIAGVVGAFMTALSFMNVSLSPVYFALPAISAHPELAGTGLIGLDMAQKSMETTWFFGSFLCYGLAVTWIACEALRTGTGPAWLNWTGIVAGVAGVVWLRAFFAFLMPVALVGTMLNIILLSLWAVGLPLVLWRRAR